MLSRSFTLSFIACVTACSATATDPGVSSFAGGAGVAGAGVAGAGVAGAAGAPPVIGSAGMSGGGSAAMPGAGASGGGAGGASGGMSGGGAGGASGGMSGSAGSSGNAGAGGGGPSGLQPKQSLIWIWLDYKNSIDAVVKNKKSFTHVSPALYNLNYNYTSGTPHFVGDMDSFSGMTSKAVATAIHAGGLKVVPLMYAGAGNFGTDQGIQNVLNDNPPGTQKNFIDATIAEATAKGYDGWNLDWEVDGGGTNFNDYGAKLITFFTAYTAALHQHNMVASFDAAGWFTRQCSSNGLVDLSKIGNSIDQLIMEDYSGKFGGPAKSCPATPPTTVSCDDNYLAEMNAMCNLPKNVANIGLISPDGGSGGTNKFAVDALNAVDLYGFRSVSLWPDSGSFINSSGVQNGSDWYKVLADWLAKP